MGAQEKEARTVNIRNRDDPATQSKGEMVGLDVAFRKLKMLKEKRSLINSLPAEDPGDSQTSSTDLAGAYEALKKKNAGLEAEIARLKLQSATISQ